MNIALLDKNNQLQESIVGKSPYMDLTTLWDIPEDEEREALMEIYKVLGGENGIIMNIGVLTCLLENGETLEQVG